MKNILEQLDSVQFDHSRWLNELVFSLKEIELYQRRLLELAKEDKEKSETISEMYDEFSSQKKLINGIKSKIGEHVINMGQLAHANGQMAAIINTGHNEIREEMEAFRHQYATLKENFHRFSAFQP